MKTLELFYLRDYSALQQYSGDLAYAGATVCLTNGAIGGGPAPPHTLYNLSLC
jgi:hypothetical protein